jgi:hypothetical protein
MAGIVVQLNGATIQAVRDTINVIGNATIVDNSTNDCFDLTVIGGVLSTGVFTLASGAATIADTTITSLANVVLLTNLTAVNQGFLRVTLTVGVGFTVTSSSPTDGSQVMFAIF